jgi:hypothetical protein
MGKGFDLTSYRLRGSTKASVVGCIGLRDVVITASFTAAYFPLDISALGAFSSSILGDI